jgi:hypothetical protein
MGSDEMSREMADCITSSNPLREHQRTGQSIARRNSLEFLQSLASYRLHRRPRSPRANFSAHVPMTITGRRVVPLREMLIMPPPVRMVPHTTACGVGRDAYRAPNV